jgi:hypothetical protein
MAVLTRRIYAMESIKGMKTVVTSRIISPLVSGRIKNIRIKISPSHVMEEENVSGEAAGRKNNEIEIARYIRADRDKNLVCAIAYSQEVKAARSSNSVLIHGAYWGYAGGGVGYDGGFFQIKDSLEPEVLDFEQAEQSDQSKKFNSLMKIVSNLYIWEDGNSTLSQDGQGLIDSGHTEGNNKVYWDSNFQSEDLGKVSRQWTINWRFDWDEINAKDLDGEK